MSFANFNQMEEQGEPLCAAKQKVKALIYKTLDAELAHLEQPVKEYFRRFHCEDRDTDHMILGSLYDHLTYEFYARPDTSAQNIQMLIKKWLPDEIESAVSAIAEKLAAAEHERLAQSGQTAAAGGGLTNGGSDNGSSAADKALKAPPRKAAGRQGKRSLCDETDGEAQLQATAASKAEMPGRRVSSRRKQPCNWWLG
jgi:hypothetical protein